MTQPKMWRDQPVDKITHGPAVEPSAQPAPAPVPHIVELLPEKVIANLNEIRGGDHVFRIITGAVFKAHQGRFHMYMN
jgi:hypothetical protein